MKTINAPYIPLLDKLSDTGRLCNILNINGTKINIDTVDWPDKADYAPKTTARIAHSGKSLYILYDVCELCVKAEHTANQSPVSMDSCVEFFVDPLLNGHYWNLEFNCIGAVNASHRSRRDNKTPLTDAEIASIRRYSSLGTKPVAERDGATQWQILIIVPFNLLGIEYVDSPYQIRCNFNKCASGSKRLHYLTWNPIETPSPDFHRPDYFGTLMLE